MRGVRQRVQHYDDNGADRRAAYKETKKTECARAVRTIAISLARPRTPAEFARTPYAPRARKNERCRQVRRLRRSRAMRSRRGVYGTCTVQRGDKQPMSLATCERTMLIPRPLLRHKTHTTATIIRVRTNARATRCADAHRHKRIAVAA